MKMRAPALLCLLALALTSCVVRYTVASFEPAQQAFPDTRATPIIYTVRPVLEQAQQPAVLTGTRYLLSVINLANPVVWLDYPSVPSAYELSNPWEALPRVLGKHPLFPSPAKDSPPEKGVMVVIDGEYFPKKRIDACASALLSGLSLSIIPYYCDETGLTIRYDLFVDRHAKKTYEYEIRKKGMAGLLLLPFAWVNLFTDDLADAIARTAMQFLHDAARDGYLSSEENETAPGIISRRVAGLTETAGQTIIKSGRRSN